MNEPDFVATPVPARDTELPSVPNDAARPSTIRGRRIALSILLLLSFLAVARLAAPLWVGIAFGTMMAFTAQPTYRFLNRHLHERRGTAAALTTVLTGLVVAVCG